MNLNESLGPCIQIVPSCDILVDEFRIYYNIHGFGLLVAQAWERSSLEYLGRSRSTHGLGENWSRQAAFETIDCFTCAGSRHGKVL
jgi:hypothetical protein